MPRVLENVSELRRMRNGLNGGRGMSAQTVADRLVNYLNQRGLKEEPKTYAWILRMEERGTSDHWVIKGLAEIYNRSEEEIERAAIPPEKLITNCSISA